MSLYHRFVQIQAYKHDGSFHRLWSHAFVVRDDEDFIVVVSNRARVIESNEHRWHTKEKAAFIFAKNEWFNTIATLREDGIHFYVNIASPAIIDQGMIKFIDYDLDIKSFPSGFNKVLDINEFNAHCRKYGYSEDLKSILKYTLEVNLARLENHEPPYQKELIDQYIANFDNYVIKQVELKPRGQD
ncbi:MAG: DUF402 domain-containing protein [Bacilli bacterium]|nr:DUF402 domain-containing protein [Bacilli bacterium]